MRLQGAPQPWLRVPGRLRLASVVLRETTRETDRLRRHLGDFQTALPEERVCPETPKPHSASPDDAPRHHNLPIAPYDYLMINARKPAHDAFAEHALELHLSQYQQCPHPCLLGLVAAEDFIVCSFVADVAHGIVVQDCHEPICAEDTVCRIGDSAADEVP